MQKKTLMRCVSIFFLVLAIVSGLIAVAYAHGDSGTTDLSNLTSAAGSQLEASFSWSNNASTSQGAGNAVVSNNSIVVTAKGYNAYIKKGATTLILTLKNGSGVSKKLTFTLTKGTVGGSVTVSGYEAQTEASKTYEIDLDTKGECTVTLVTAANGTENKVTLSGVTLKSSDSVSVKYISPTDQQGNVTGTYSTVGTTVSYEDDITGLTVTPNSDYKFICWRTEDGKDLGTSTTGFTKPDTTSDVDGDGHVSVYPYLVPKTAGTYKVDDKLYYYWNDAVTAAKAGGKKIILVAGGTLPGGTAYNMTGTYVVADSNGNVTYNLPSDCQFLIPFSATDSGTFGSGENFKNNSSATPSTYITLQVASGAKLVCDGQMNVNGHRYEYTQPHSGRASGTHGKMVLNGNGTQLVVNGTLYCYGYITGSGDVEVNGTLHELLQMASWPGGTSGSDWSSAAESHTILFLAHYYVQNVEADLKINSTANVYAETVVSVDTTSVLGDTLGSVVSVRDSCRFIAPSANNNTEGLFLLGTGTYITRSYDPSTDRITYSTGGSGSIGFGSISISAKVAGLIGVDVVSSKYTLPVSSAMTLKIGSGTTLTMGNRVALLPGAQVIVEEKATVNLNSHLYVLDLSDWKDTMFYQNGATNKATAAYYTAGRGTKSTLTVTASAMLQIDGTLNISESGGIFTSSTSSNIDKIIYGKGTIIKTGAVGTGTLNAGYTGTLYDITSVPGLARLAGLTASTDKYHSMGTGTYIGLGSAYNHYWYQNKITVTGVADTVIKVSGTLSIGDQTSGDGIVGYIVNGGTFVFTLEGMTACSITATNASITYKDGVYTLVGDEDGGDVVITIVPHSYTSEVTAPTCTAKGYTTHTCSNCGDSYKDTYTDTIAHSYDAGIVTTNPTCTAAGIKTFTCSACGGTKTEAVAATGHSYISIVTAPTCTAKGYTTHTCSNCGDSYTDAEVAATGHTAGAAATCTTAQTCTVCGEVLVAKLGHTWVDADCDTPKTCSTCKATEGDALGHSYESTVTAPTCTEAGYTTHTCTRCSNSYKDTEVAATGHNYESVVTAPTCTEDGYTTYTCACGVSYVADEVESHGHNYETVTVNPTCTEDGSITYTCSACGDNYTETVVATGHSYESVVTEPTCTEDGYTTYTCACGHSYTEVVAATGHSYNAVVTAPTCTESGYTTYTCACGDSYTSDVVMALGHTYDEGEVTEALDCYTPGKITYTCSTCYHTKIVETSAKHNYEEGSVICKDCDKFEFHAANVRLGNNLDMMFAFPKDGLQTDTPTGYYVQIVRTRADGTTTTETIPASLWKLTEVDEIDCYFITYSGFAAKEMSDTIALTIYRTVIDGDDVPVSAEWKDSIQNYAMRMLEKATEELELDADGNGTPDVDANRKKYLTRQRTLVVDMLNYGAACQNHFSHNLTDLANGLLSDEQKAYGTQTVTNKPTDNDQLAAERETTSNGYYYGATLIADSNSTFVMGFTNKLSEDAYIVYTFTNHRDVPVQSIVYFSDLTTVYGTDGATVLYRYRGLSYLRIADVRQDISIAVYDKDENGSYAEVATWTDSIARYVARMSKSDSDVYMALLKFADSACAYLHYSEVE